MKAYAKKVKRSDAELGDGGRVEDVDAFQNDCASPCWSNRRMAMPVSGLHVTRAAITSSSSKSRPDKRSRCLVAPYWKSSLKAGFTCLIAENPDDAANPITFKPVEFIFPDGESFKHYDMKWIDYEKMSFAPVNDPPSRKCCANRPLHVQIHGW